MGEHVHGVLLEGDVEPMSLSKEYREALELFECYNSDVQITSILKPQQRNLLDMLDVSPDREITSKLYIYFNLLFY